MILLHWPSPALRERLAAVPFVGAPDCLAGCRHACARARRPDHRRAQVQQRRIDALPNLGLIVTIGSGFEAIDDHALRARGIRLANSSGINSGDVADMAVGLFLALVHGIVPNDACVRDGGWVAGAIRPTQSVGAMSIGIFGMGHIGQAIAARLRPFGCSIAWHGPNPKPQLAFPHVPDLLSLARQSDALIVATPLNARTRGIIDSAVLEAIGASRLLINISRGDVVDEECLRNMLREGKLGNAGLDVFHEEPSPPELWRDIPNLVLSPHTGGITFEGTSAILATAVARATAFFDRTDDVAGSTP